MVKVNAEKLQIKAGDVVYVAGADLAELDLLKPLPEGAAITGDPVCQAAVLFTKDRSALDRFLADLPVELSGARAVWIAYPKGGRSDINRDRIADRVAEFGWKVNSNVALDDVWSALRMKFVR